MSGYRCPECRDTGILRDRGRLYGDPDTLTTCDCGQGVHDWLTPKIEAEARAKDEADRLMSQAHRELEEQDEA